MGEMDQSIGSKCIKHGGGSDYSSYFQKVDENGGSQPTFFLETFWDTEFWNHQTDISWYTQ
jgi:hypothetical protein